MVSGHIAQAVGQSRDVLFRPDAGFLERIAVPAKFAGVTRYIYECADNACRSSGKVCPASVEIIPPWEGGKKYCLKYINERSFIMKEVPVDGRVVVHGAEKTFSWPRPAEISGSGTHDLLIDTRKTFGSCLFEKDSDSQLPLPYPKGYEGGIRTTWFLANDSEESSSLPAQEVIISEQANEYCFKITGSRSYVQLPIPVGGVVIHMNGQPLSKISPREVLPQLRSEHKVLLEWSKVSDDGCGRFSGKATAAEADTQLGQVTRINREAMLPNYVDGPAPGFVFHFSCISCNAEEIVTVPTESTVCNSSYPVFYFRMRTDDYIPFAIHYMLPGDSVGKWVVKEGTSRTVSFHGVNMELFGCNYPGTASEKPLD